MDPMADELAQEVARLRRSVGRTRLALAAVGLGAVGVAVLGLARVADPVRDEVRARKFVLVDDEGVVRAMLQQDRPGGQRRSRGAGLLVFDKHGHERGGFSTMDDDSVVMAMDAPRGVGAPMPDRIGLVVDPDGSSSIMIIDNKTRGVARMDSDAEGIGGLKVFKWETENNRVHVKTFTYDGEKIETHPTGGG